MTIDFNKGPGDRILELGCGDSPSPASDVCVDVRRTAATHFTVDFEAVPWPIADADFTCVYAHFLLEHISYPKVPAFLGECFRVLKPGGKVVFAVPDTLAQFEWVLEHGTGWDGKDLFTAASELLFGSQDYPENSHRSFWCPATADRLLRGAGFAKVGTKPYGARDTDLLVTAEKPLGTLTSYPVVLATSSGFVHEYYRDNATGPMTLVELEAQKMVEEGCPHDEALPHETAGEPARVERSLVAKKIAETFLSYGKHYEEAEQEAEEPELSELIARHEKAVAATAGLPARPATLPADREALFDKMYFNGGQKVGGYMSDAWGAYRDFFPAHENTFRHVMLRRPKSVLELGCARGYVLKRLQDAGVAGHGLEISKHCHMTRVCEGVALHDLCSPWPSPHGVEGRASGVGDWFDLCFSIATLEHVPEEYLPAVIREMARTCSRGLHGVDFGQHDDGFDKTHCTLQPREWWLEMFGRHAPGWSVEVLDKEELEKGYWDLKDLFADGGRVKLNVGSFTTMFHHGWHNLDVHDLGPYAAQHGYRYVRHDVRAGLPCDTGAVDLVFAHHFLEHLTYKEGLAFLKECRRVLKPETGALRLAVPDAAFLTSRYHNYLCDVTGNHSDFGTETLDDFAEINDGVAAAPTAAGKLWALLHEGHQSAYDGETLLLALREAGFIPCVSPFRGCNLPEPERAGPLQILRETTEMTLGGISLFADAVPLCG